MGELVFVGLGLHDETGMTLRGLEEAKRCDLVLAEFYTNPMPNLSLEKLGSLLGQQVHVLSRSEVEEDPMGKVLAHARDKRVAFLVSGDPMIATTHVELRLLAERNGIKTKLVHSSSVYTVGAGAAGLQLQKFGRTVSLPILEDLPFPESVYDFIARNKQAGMHTLVLLEHRRDGKFLSIQNALRTLTEVNDKHMDGQLGDEALGVGLARLGSPDEIVRGDRLGDLKEVDFGPPPHSLIVPGRLHFKEAEALEAFAHVPRSLVEAYL